jgi:hypothetical protein
MHADPRNRTLRREIRQIWRDPSGGNAGRTAVSTLSPGTTGLQAALRPTT